MGNRFRRIGGWAVFSVVTVALSACDSRSSGTGPTGTPKDDSAGSTDTASLPDATTTPNDVTTDLPGTDTPAPVVTQCNTTLAEPASGPCTIEAGSATAYRIRGQVMTPAGLLLGGEIVISGDKVTCAACDCATAGAGATTLTCPKVLITPGLINPHDHIGWAQHPPVPHGDERYDHRHEWRKGLNGKTKLPADGNFNQSLGAVWGELRMVMSGVTSMMGSGGGTGFVRNLDVGTKLEGLAHGTPETPTFPLGDSDGKLVTSGCGFPGIDKIDPTKLAAETAYVPHVAEGINEAARREFVCLSEGKTDVVMKNAAFIHGIGVTTEDIGLMAADSTGLVWSPRSNISLYGFTADVAIYQRLGVRIAIGSDWPLSGSMNLVRELKCADDLNKTQYGGFFNDRQLVDMASQTAADIAGFGDLLGSLSEGKIADVTLWDASAHAEYRAVLDSGPADVLLVLRGGRALYGDAALVTTFAASDACDTLDVCGRPKALCAKRETAKTMSEIQAGVANDGTEKYDTYPLFFCDAPKDEPTCVPSRPKEFTGLSTNTDRDGDGIADAADNCPTFFNPPRPLDKDKDGKLVQPNVDADGQGDACDPCPFDANTESCTSVNPTDIDKDGIPNLTDNCPNLANPDQANGDSDARGDACDSCPAEADPCKFTVYQVKKGEVKEGTAVTLPPMVVTSIVKDSGYFVQHAPTAAGFEGAEYSGIFVHDPAGSTTRQRRDGVTVAGTVTGYFGQIQIDKPTVTVLAPEAEIAAVTVAPADVKTDGPKAAAFEGVLVQVSDVVVTDTAPKTAQPTPPPLFAVTDGLIVSGQLYALEPAPVTGDTLASVRGVMTFIFDDMRLVPRDAADVVAGPPKLKDLWPAKVFVEQGQATTAPPLFVRLTGPAKEDMVVSITSSDEAIAKPTSASVTVKSGESQVAVPLTGVLANATAVTLTAKLGDISKTGSVRVFSADEPRTVTLLLPSPITMSTGGAFEVLATLDLPAKKAPSSTVLTVTADTTDLLTLPKAIVLPDGALEAKFTLTALTKTGATQLSVTTDDAGVTPMTTTVTVTDKPPAGLVLVEVLYDPDGADDGQEWVKLYNGSGQDVSLVGYSLGYGGTSYVSGKVTLSGTLKAGECFVIGGPTANDANGNPVFHQSFNFSPDIQNGVTPADGIGLFMVPSNALKADMVPVDALIYGKENTSGLLDATGKPGTAMSPGSGSGKSLLRKTATTWETNATPNAVACPTVL